MKENWYHVILLESKVVFGFAALDGLVTKAPYDYSWMINKTLKEVKLYFITNKCIITNVTGTI